MKMSRKCMLSKINEAHFWHTRLEDVNLKSMKKTILEGAIIDISKL